MARGYSLVELMVVIAMVMILSGFAAGSLLAGSDEQESYQVVANVANIMTKARGRAIGQQKAYLITMTTSGSATDRGTFRMYEGNGPFSRSCRNNNWTALEPVGGGADAATIYGGMFRDQLNANANLGATAIPVFSSIQFGNGELTANSTSNTTPAAASICFDAGGVYYAAGPMTSSAIRMNRSVVRIRFKRDDDSGAIRQINLGSNGVPRIEQNITAWNW